MGGRRRAIEFDSSAAVRTAAAMRPLEQRTSPAMRLDSSFHPSRTTPAGAQATSAPHGVPPCAGDAPTGGRIAARAAARPGRCRGRAAGVRSTARSRCRSRRRSGVSAAVRRRHGRGSLWSLYLAALSPGHFFGPAGPCGWSGSIRRLLVPPARCPPAALPCLSPADCRYPPTVRAWPDRD